jgi:hypothetical protein
MIAALIIWRKWSPYTAGNVNTLNLLLKECGKAPGIIVMAEITYLMGHEPPATGSQASIHYGEFVSTRTNTAWLHSYTSAILDHQAASYHNEKRWIEQQQWKGDVVIE